MKNILQTYLFLFVFTLGIVHAQPQEMQPTITIESEIKDDQGLPIQGAKIYGKEGAIVVKSDVAGHFKITVPESTRLLIEADGYKSQVVTPDEALLGINLQAAPFMRGEKDDVQVAFGTVKKADLLGDISVIKPSEFIQYDNTLYVPDAITGRVAGMYGGNNIRGLGDALVVLDGIPRYSKISEVNLNMEEIDQITVLKDVEAVALYGSQARNGVILITTKRGEAYKRDINVSVQYGIARPKALPQYLGSADYMELYNEAATNDGLPIKYDEAMIANYRNGNPYRYPSVDYYSSDYLKPFRTYSNAIAEFSNGDENTQFYANLGWGNNGSLLDFGRGKDASSNQFNARANVDFKINDFIKSNVDIAGIFNFSKTPKGSYYQDASRLRPYLFSPLLPLDLMERNNVELQTLVDARKNEVDGQYLLGGTQQNQSTPFADMYAGGINQPVSRTMQFNNGIDVDLGMLTKGLSLKTNMSFDYYNSYNQNIANSYSIYQPEWSAPDSITGLTQDSITGLTQYGLDAKPGTQNVDASDFLRRIGLFAQLDYDRTFAGEHNVTATLLGFANTIKLNGTLQPDKNAHLGLRLGYNYKNKYYTNFSGAYVHSVQLAEGSSGALSPTLSLGWVISKEDFLLNSKNIDYLKLKASAGVINTDISLGGFYYYEAVLSGQGHYTWGDGDWSNSGIGLTRGANSALGFEQRQELNLGLEGQFFSRSVLVDANIFSTRIANKYTRRVTQYPTYYSDFIPWDNYDIDGYKGAELGITYSKKMGDFGFDLGVTGMYWSSKVIRKDEIYSEDYLYREGKPVDSYFGYEALGLFQDADDIEDHAFQTFGVVKPGDIKYKDQNDDGVIDSNDQVEIGRWNAPLTYGLNLKISWKNFSLFAIGTGFNGADAILGGSYYRPDGDNKYSVIAKERWTPETSSTAKYPRLSSQTNTNNNQNSTFWLYSNNFFSLNRVQLTYELPESICGKLAMKGLSIYVSGSDIGKISKHNDVGYLNVGREPQYRYFTLGLRSIF
jgi:TonB-linked SusC/RagA family outer membrane protein